MRKTTVAAGLTAVLLAVLSAGAAASGPVAADQHPQAFVERAEEAFAAGELDEAVALFDRLARLDPETAPWMWQRGIALYYLGRYDACAAQFADYQQVNPGDLESAVWHVACVARARSIDEARRVMFPPGRDARIMRAEIYEMFAGRLPPGVVLERARFAADVAVFYASFYAALYLEVVGDQEAARRLLTRATDPRYDGLAGFMNVVARVHRARLEGEGRDEEER